MRIASVRDAVVLNAGIALAVVDEGGSGRFGTHATFEDALAAGVARAGTAIDDGAAARSLQNWVTATRGG